MHIYTRLGVVPTATTTVHEATRLRATIICVFSIEEIIDLAQ